MNANEMVDLAERLSNSYNRNGYYDGDSSPGCTGGTRTVLIQDQYAFKMARTTAAAVANMVEWDFYAMTTDEIRAMLSHPFYISRNGNVVVMERLQTRDNPYNKVVQFIDELKAVVDLAHNIRLTDIWDFNCGMRQDGTILCLDYGELARYGFGMEKYEKMSLFERMTGVAA
jgi:hypothetical protein